MSEYVEVRVYNGGIVLKEEGGLVLTAPLNSWDMNYRLYDIENGTEDLIDIDDMPEEYELEDLKEYSHKTYTTYEEETQ